MKKIFSVVIIGLILFLLPGEAQAIYDPLSVANNKFGIHIQSENDLDAAKNLVNSSGGDWGYVTLVITEKEREHGRWQRVFDEMRKKHLIPIIRIASRVEDESWMPLKNEDIENWVNFLDSLNWVVKNRYVIIGNEPNHAKEWGERLSPGEYASYLKDISVKLKSASDDFFILPAGLDASAPNSKETMEESKFISLMIEAETDIFNYVDGWTSHSYPNPAFSGSPTQKGKGSIATFDWELSFLKSIGITKSLPVFITETGWSREKLDEVKIADNLIYAFKNTWSDERIVAVTPFILNYEFFPFDLFSWQKSDGTFYGYYSKVADESKTAGAPIQEVKGKIVSAFINPFLLPGSNFRGVIFAQNLGQSIWVSPEVSIDEESKAIKLAVEHYQPLEPLGYRLIYFNSVTPKIPGKYKLSLVLTHNGRPISDKYNLQMNMVMPSEVKTLSLFGKIQVWFISVLKFFQGL